MRPAILLALLVFGRIMASAQTVDAKLLGQTVNLGSKWLYHAGDDSRWSGPDLPDHAWKVVSTDAGLNAVETRGLGYSWYRLHVQLPSSRPPALKLLVEYQGNPYEVFVNGVKVGQFGRFPPHPLTLSPMPRSFAIPAGLVKSDTIVIAVRMWGHWQGWGWLQGPSPIAIASAVDADNALAAKQAAQMYGWVPDGLVRFLSLALAGGLLILFRWNRESTEYLWIAGYFVAMTCWTAADDYRMVAEMSHRLYNYCYLGFLVVAQVFLFEFTFAFLKRPMPRWLRGYQLSMLLQVAVLPALYAGWIPDNSANLMLFVWILPYSFLLPGMVIWRYAKGQKEAGLLAIPIFLINFNDMLENIGSLLWRFHLRKTSDAFIPPFDIGPVRVWIGQIEGLLFVLSIGALLLYRFHRTSRDKVRAESELEAARSMQDVMVPKRLQHTGGFAVESAYLPAQEVGGDFFQLYPGGDGSLLVVIGDVSGKGVKAAMLVSMILGLLQRSVELTRSPSKLLSDLNRCLIGQTDGKFATCCCALLLADGTVIAANAGHLSPYCDGAEIDLPGSLPLGMSADADYEEIELHLPPGKRWLFISDGVVEARSSRTGELYGFDRTRSISILAVNQIAQTVQEFGQEDDITVLGIERQAVAFA